MKLDELIDPFIYAGHCYDCEWHTSRYKSDSQVFNRRVEHETENESHTTWVDEIPVPMFYFED